MRATGPALAVTGACAVLFGASFAAGTVTRGGDRTSERPAPAKPSPTTPTRSLALGSAPALPGLQRLPRHHRPAAGAAPVVVASAAPAPAARPVRRAARRRSTPTSIPVSSPPATSAPSQPSQPRSTAPAPTPKSTPAKQPSSDFYSSG